MRRLDYLIWPALVLLFGLWFVPMLTRRDGRPLAVSLENNPHAEKVIWEYITVERPDSNIETINRAGEEGWELVAVLPAETPATKVYFFKRPKPSRP